MTTATAPTTETPAAAATDAPAPTPAKLKFVARSVNFFYAAKQALIDVSLSIPEKQVTAFIGPSGCGKSTFLRLLNRMNDTIAGVRLEGSITMDGADITGSDVDVVTLRRRVGMVFQKSNPFPKSIFENVAYGPRIHGSFGSETALAELVEKSLRQAALWDEVKDRLHTSAMGMSGGQAQRLCIARALAVEPEVLLMDEPTSALDPASTLQVEKLVAELKKQYTVIIVTHNMQQATRISDRTAFFYNGKLIEDGPTEQIFGSPREKQTEDYVKGRFG